MKLTPYDLKQLDEEKISAMPHDGLVHCAKTLLCDLKEAIDRLNQNSQNSSRPSGSEAPWEGVDKDEEGGADQSDEEDNSETKRGKRDSEGSEDASNPAEDEPDHAGAEGVTKGANDGDKDSNQTNKAESVIKRKAGKQLGAQGYGRKQHLEVSGIENHFVCTCAACGAESTQEAQVAWNGWHSIDIAETDPTKPGIFLTNTKHILYSSTCSSCGHENRVYPYKAGSDAFWDKTDLNEWRLIGPRLAGMIVLLAMRFRLSRARIREFLMEFLGLTLSIGAINGAISEAARGGAPLEAELLEDIGKAAIAYADETSWLEAGNPCWLWVLKTSCVIFFFVGRRDRRTFDATLSKTGFSKSLMTDGYGVYRDYPNRLRCWAHLIRKARGLAESCDNVAAVVGTQILALFKTLQDGIYAARALGVTSIEATHADPIKDLIALCAQYKGAIHEKLKKLCREILNDQEVILRQTRETSLPLTNNEAEGGLRHWVISRRLSYGTRTPAGTKAFTILASVIETCRLRGIPVWNFIAKIIDASRKGLFPPPLHAAWPTALHTCTPIAA